MDFGDNLVQSKGRCHELSHAVNINGFLSWDTRFISFSQYEKSIFPSRLIRWILFLWRFYLPFLSCLHFVETGPRCRGLFGDVCSKGC